MLPPSLNSHDAPSHPPVLPSRCSSWTKLHLTNGAWSSQCRQLWRLLGSFDVDASFLCDSWRSLARGHGLCLPLPRGKTLEHFFAERVRRLPGESHGHSVFSFFLRARSVRKNVLFSEFLVSHKTSRRRLTQTVPYSSAHSSASPFPVGTLSSDAENRLRGSRLLIQCCSEERQDPTDAVLGLLDDIRCCSTTGAWSCQRRQLWRFRSCLGSLWKFHRCSSWSSLTRPFCLPAVVCSSTRWSMSLLCCAMGFCACRRQWR